MHCQHHLPLQVLEANQHEQRAIRLVHARGLATHYKSLQKKAAEVEAQNATRHQAAAVETFPHLYAAAGASQGAGAPAGQPSRHTSGSMPSAATTGQPAALAGVQQLLWAQQVQLAAYAALQGQLLQQQAHVPQPGAPSTSARVDAVDRYKAKKTRRSVAPEVSSASNPAAQVRHAC